MQKPIQLISAAMAAVLALLPACGGAAALSVDEPAFAEAEGAQTILYYENGAEVRRSGYPSDGSALPGVERYEVYLDGEAAFSVGVNDAQPSSAVGAQPTAGGYYTLDLTLSHDRALFVTGLSKSSLSIYQNLIVRKYNHTADFSYTDAGFVDAEKSAQRSNDDNLCWAGQASNSLHFTGWGAKAGFADEDDIFDAFADAFYDQGGYEELAYDWFFDGVFAAPFALSDFYPGLKKSGSGGYLRDYCADTLYTAYDVSEFSPEAFLILTDSLRANRGVGLGVHWWTDGELYGGHAITCWGYIVNNSYDDTDMRHYEALIISDSDSDEPYDNDRRVAPNNYTVVCLEPNSREDAPSDTCYWLPFYSDDCFLMDFSALVRCEEAEPETDPMATKDKDNTPDFWTQGAMLYDETFFAGETDAMPSVRKIYIAPYLYNASAMAAEGKISCSVTVTDSSGSVVAEKTQVFDFALDPFTAMETEDSMDIGRLPAGDYQVTLTANGERAFQEAYFVNNTAEWEFTVEDMPFGDVNGDGVANVVDATQIQWWDVTPDDVSDEWLFLADVNGDGEVNVVDATVIQKFAAGYPVTLGECVSE